MNKKKNKSAKSHYITTKEKKTKLDKTKNVNNKDDVKEKSAERKKVKIDKTKNINNKDDVKEKSTERKKVKIDKTSRAYIEYMKFYKNNFLEVDSEYVNLTNYFKNFDTLPSSYERRIIYIYLAYYFNFDTVNTITSIFKAKSLEKTSNMSNAFDVIFGFGFYDIPKNEKFHNIIIKGRDYSKNIIPKFVIINGGYDSKDGEYRNGLITHQSMDLLQSPALEKYHLNELLIDMKKYMKDKLHERKIGIYEDFFYPSEDIQMSVNYKDSYENIDRIYIYFAFAWFKFFNDRTLNITPNHLNTKYINLFIQNEKHMKEDEIFFNNLSVKYSKKAFTILRYALNNFINYYFHTEDELDKLLHYNIKYGQKLIPLSVSEIAHPFSIMKKTVA